MNNKMINNKYNKTIYTAVVGAFFTMVFVGLGDYGFDISGELQGSVMAFAMSVTVYFTPNKV